MLSVVIPTLNAAAPLARLLEELAAGPVDEVVVADGGSADDTAAVARAAGARVVTACGGRGPQLAAGAEVASGDRLLFLHADSIPGPGWTEALETFFADERNRRRAGYFRLALDDSHPGARRVERLAAWRAARLGLPYGDQGLAMARTLYVEVGGFRPLPLMEDVDMARRLGRNRLVALGATCLTSAERYRRDGWWMRPAGNLACLSLFFLGVPAGAIRRLYG